MPSSNSFLRQLSGREGWKSTSNRWRENNNNNKKQSRGGGLEGGLRQMEGFNMYGNGGENGGGLAMRKRVMVVVDESSHSKHAMMWALTHVANKGDLLTLLHIVPSSHKPDRASDSSSSSSSPYLANSLGSLCKACKPEVCFCSFIFFFFFSQ
ncbi:hypothetical protein FEM48_Zijuj06G0127500 [Ziziphus jujuba var. spinosa]|uniref:UspA domain-containing protein n=1 Tax=Ziziphus jujuba var. spinosa TaxID=714518 RepID=A0A978V9C9_ZIZJJ|nr:hypothetical protein FEM48_Zijuj06G0127500 [Ziziphus jujuba var. spinosa]